MENLFEPLANLLERSQADHAGWETLVLVLASPRPWKASQHCRQWLAVLVKRFLPIFGERKVLGVSVGVHLSTLPPRPNGRRFSGIAQHTISVVSVDPH